MKKQAQTSVEFHIFLHKQSETYNTTELLKHASIQDKSSKLVNSIFILS